MEKILQYAWKWRMYGNADLQLTDGRKIRILDPGIHNTSGDGPDFFNAKILLDGFEWAGNVELHVKASDWWRHNHHLDPEYGNIILHVVAVNDATLKRQNGLPVPQLLFPLKPELVELYTGLIADASVPPPLRCWNKLNSIPSLLLKDAIYSAAFERLKAKSLHIIHNLRYLDGDLSHACIAAIARALGFGINSQPFEQTALRLNINHCSRHSDNPLQLDALLLGTAGLLSSQPSGAQEYFSRLQSEFAFLAHKYRITPLNREIWKLSSTRPQNSPYRRLAYLARIIPKANIIASGITEDTCNLRTLSQLLDIEFEDFWSNHYSFTYLSPNISSRALTDSTLQLLIINAIAPLTFAIGLLQGNARLEEKAADTLTDLPSEQNSLIKDWKRVGIKARNAFESQGLIQLRKQYCDRNECLKCRIGNRLLRCHALPAQPVPSPENESYVGM